jgi:hypothetical protein
VSALDIEPVDRRAGGYVWTAVDGSLVIGGPDNLRDQLFADPTAELWPLERVLTDLAGHIASAWR